MLIRYEDIPKPVEIKAEECVDDLQLAGLRLIQKKDGFKLGMDSVLLADFAQIYPGDRVADFGTGTGALPLLLRGRGKGEHYYAFEIQQELAETAARTMMLNGLENQVQIYAEDAGNAAEILPGNSLDAII